MVGHGFKSEIAQNKTMASTFDDNVSNDTPKSQSLQHLSTNQTNPPDISLGKKVNFLEKIVFFIK